MLLERLNDKNKPLYLDLELHLAMADGNLGEEEKDLIDVHCAEMGIGNNDYVNSLSYEETLDKVNSDFTLGEKKIAYIELVSIALVDEVITDEEKEYLNKVKNLLGIPEDDATVALEIMSNLIKYGKALDEYVG